VLAIKFLRWQKLLIRLFVGDGEHTGTGAAEDTGIPPPDFTKIRTRRDLAIIINKATDPVAIKQEILEQQQTEPMEYDNEENFLEILGGSGHDPHSMDEDEALLDEEEEEVVSGGEEEVVEGEEEEGESGNSGESGEEDEDNGDAEGEVTGGADADTGAVADADAGADGGYRGVSGATAAENMIVQEGEVGAGELEVQDGTSGAGPGNVAGGSGVGEGVGDIDGDGEDDLLPELERDELDSSLRPDNRFFAVRALVEGGRCATKLNRRMKLEAAEKDSFLVKGDERFFRNANESSIDRRVNVSSSFTLSGRCHTCLNGTHDAWQGRQGQPVVMSAGDQHYPANLPARGDGECIRILRVENGSLAEITGEVIRMSPRGGGGRPWHSHHAGVGGDVGGGECGTVCR
jgi:hypothetical protein